MEKSPAASVSEGTDVCVAMQWTELSRKAYWYGSKYSFKSSG